MMKLGTINDKNDMKIGKSDFVVEHKKGKLLQYYKLDENKVLGQGKHPFIISLLGSFGMVQ